jgi:hypothetical protein
VPVNIGEVRSAELAVAMLKMLQPKNRRSKRVKHGRMNMSATSIPSACRIANIDPNDAMILPHDANPDRMTFSERTSCPRSRSGHIGFRFRLDFAKEWLIFDAKTDIGGRDDGTAELSRKDSFIAVNCFLDLDAANAEIDRWKVEVMCRRAASRGFGKRRA